MKHIVGQDFSLIGKPPRYVGAPHPSQPGDLGLYKDPNFAKVFTNKKDAQTFLTETANLGEYGKVYDLPTAILAWEESIKNGFFFHNICSVAPANLKPITVADSDDCRNALLKWWLVDYTPNVSNVPQGVYSANSNALMVAFKFLHAGGYWQDTGQATLTLRLNPPPPPEKITQLVKEVEMALPFIKESEAEWDDINLPTKRLDLLEPNLSKNASFRVEHSSKGWRLAYNRYSTPGITFAEKDTNTFFSKLCFHFKTNDEENEE